MKALSYRTNRVSYTVQLAILIAAYVVMLFVIKMERVPGAEAIVFLFTVPRLHDIGRSGWWLLALLAGEIIAIIIGWPYGVDGILIAGGLFVMCALLLLVILAFVPGQPKANRWGEPPEPGIRFGRPKVAVDQ